MKNEWRILNEKKYKWKLLIRQIKIYVKRVVSPKSDTIIFITASVTCSKNQSHKTYHHRTFPCNGMFGRILKFHLTPALELNENGWKMRLLCVCLHLCVCMHVCIEIRWKRNQQKIIKNSKLKAMIKQIFMIVLKMLRLNFMFSWDVCIHVVCIQVKGICRQMQPQPSQRTRITNEHRNEKYLRVNGHFFWTMLLLILFFVSSRWFCHISSYFVVHFTDICISSWTIASYVHLCKAKRGSIRWFVEKISRQNETIGKLLYLVIYKWQRAKCRMLC